MEQNFQESAARAAKLLASPQGRDLLSALQSIPENQREAIGKAMASGDMETAKSIISPWLRDPENASLLSRVFGGGGLG